MQALFKMIVSDLFFEIIDGHTAKPGEIMLFQKTKLAADLFFIEQIILNP